MFLNGIQNGKEFVLRLILIKQKVSPKTRSPLDDDVLGSLIERLFSEYYFIPDWYKKHIEDAAHELALKKARAEEERLETMRKMAETPDGEAIVLD